MKVLSILAIVTFVSGIYSDYYGSIIWSDMHGHYRAFIDVWLPYMPYLVFWFFLIFCAWKDWRLILWGIPIITVKLFPFSSSYIYHYHINMGSLYYPGQALALFSVVTMTFGMILFFLHLWVRYLKYKLNNF